MSPLNAIGIIQKLHTIKLVRTFRYFTGSGHKIFMSIMCIYFRVYILQDAGAQVDSLSENKAISSIYLNTILLS